MADATIAARYGTNPLATWTGAEKIPADNGAGTGVVGLASMLKVFMVGAAIAAQGITVTTSQPLLDLSQTWNNAAVVFTAAKINATRTANGAGSKILDLWVDGTTSVFSVDAAGGSLSLPFGGIVAASNIQTNGNMYVGGGGSFQDGAGASNRVFILGTGGSITGLELKSTAAMGWSSTTDAPGTADIGLYRDAAGVLAQRITGANPQAFRVYNIFTDASNYERLGITWSANTVTIGQEALGSGTARDLNLGTSTSFVQLSPTNGPKVEWSAGALLSRTRWSNSLFRVDIGGTNDAYKFELGTLTMAASAGLPGAAAGAIEYDGKSFYATAVASTRQIIETDQIIQLTATNTLTSQTGVQPIFDRTGSGQFTLAANTTYHFECFVTLTALSATSGGFGFALGGTAVLTRQLWTTKGSKSVLATAIAPQETVNTAANVAIVTASTATVGWFSVRGMIRVGTGGTLIPQISQTTAAAAVVGVDSFFRIWPAAADSAELIGNIS